MKTMAVKKVGTQWEFMIKNNKPVVYDSNYDKGNIVTQRIYKFLVDKKNLFDKEYGLAEYFIGRKITRKLNLALLIKRAETFFRKHALQDGEGAIYNIRVLNIDYNNDEVKMDLEVTISNNQKIKVSI